MAADGGRSSLSYPCLSGTNPPSPGGRGGVRPRWGRREERGSCGAGPAAGQPPPRSSPSALILKGASAQPAAQRSRPGPSRCLPRPIPLPASRSRRPGPAVTPGRPGGCCPVGEAQENTLLRGSSARSGLVSISFSQWGARVPSRHLCGERSLHLLENLDADLVFGSHALGKGRQERSLGWIPSCLSPVLPTLRLLAGALPKPLRVWLQGREGTSPLWSCLTFNF